MKSKKILNAAIVVMLLLVPVRVWAVPGDLDATFGTGGKVITDFSGRDDSAAALAMQADDKIVVAGITTLPTAPFDLNFAVWRYNANGTPDATFGTGGIVATDIFGGATSDAAHAIVLQSDGKILVAGEAVDPYTAPTSSDFALVRYNTDGTLDPTFGTGGIVTTDIFGGATSDVARAIVLQSDGKILVAGEAVDPYTAPTSSDFALARYNTDGTLDPTFGTGGIVTTDILGGAENDFAYSMALQPDGKIIVSGEVWDPINGIDFALVRYNPNGTLDTTTFGAGTGIVTTDVSGTAADDLQRAVALQPNGRILLVGGNSSDFALVRYNSNGTLDTSFGAGTGIVTTDVGGGLDMANAVILQSNGKIVVAGTATDVGAGINVFGLARYDASGTLDTGFGTAGIVTTAMLGESDTVNALALQSNGKIIAAGETYNLGTLYQDFAMARYRGDSGFVFGSGGGGGCILNARTAFDPLFSLLVVLALAFLFRRRNSI